MLKRKQVQLTARQTQALRREAVRRGVSDSAVLRDLVDGLIVGGPRVDKDRRRKILRIIGRFRSGGRDASVEHDREFAEATTK